MELPSKAPNIVDQYMYFMVETQELILNLTLALEGNLVT